MTSNSNGRWTVSDKYITFKKNCSKMKLTVKWKTLKTLIRNFQKMFNYIKSSKKEKKLNEKNKYTKNNTFNLQ